jgi:competence protein ComEC
VIDVAVRPSDLRFAIPVAGAWAVTATLLAAPSAGVPVAVGTGVLGAVCAAAFWWTERRGIRSRVRAVLAIAVVGLLTVGLMGVATSVSWQRRSPDALRSALGDGARATVVLVADRDVEPGDRSFPATVRTAERIGAAAGAPIRVVPDRHGDAVGHIAAGSVLLVHGELLPEPSESAAVAVLFARGDIDVRAAPGGLLASTDRARTAFAEIAADLPAPGGGLLRGLAIGDRSGIDDATAAAMEATALTHLTAVSGSNCAVLVGLVMVLGRALRMPRVVRAVAAVVVLGGFVVLVRPDPSIVRATVMALVVLVVHLAGRPVRGVPLLALATIGMLLADPWTARSFAFTLSVLATGGIIVLAPPLTAILARRVPLALAAMVAVPVAAQAACWPVTVLLAPELPLFAVPVNALAEPLAPIATVVGLAACVLAPFWASGAMLLAEVAWVPSAAIAALASGAAGLPFASVPWPDGLVGVSVAVIVGVGLGAAVLARGIGARVASLAVPVALVVGVGIVAVPRAVVRGSVPGDWSIAACDVGQGDAVLVRDADAIALVDTGDEPEMLEACLTLLGVGRIGVFVASHYDTDHIGAVDVVAGRVDHALVGPYGRPADARVVEALTAGGAVVQRSAAGTTGTLGRLAWRVDWPPPSVRTGGNEASLVVRFTPTPSCVPCTSSLFLGDLDEAAQRRLVRTTPDAVLPVDVVKVSHHGSADQDPGLYRRVHALVGLIGVGADNTYGHPTASALDMLHDVGTVPYRTDLDGTIVIAPAPADQGGDALGGLRVWTERADAPRESPRPRAGRDAAGQSDESGIAMPRHQDDQVLLTETVALVPKRNAGRSQGTATRRLPLDFPHGRRNRRRGDGNMGVASGPNQGPEKERRGPHQPPPLVPRTHGLRQRRRVARGASP